MEETNPEKEISMKKFLSIQAVKLAFGFGMLYYASQQDFPEGRYPPIIREYDLLVRQAAEHQEKIPSRIDRLNVATIEPHLEELVRINAEICAIGSEVVNTHGRNGGNRDDMNEDIIRVRKANALRAGRTYQPCAFQDRLKTVVEKP